MESALCGIFTLVVFVSELKLTRSLPSLVRFLIRQQLVRTVRAHFPRSNLYILTCEDIDNFTDIKFVS